MFHNVLNCNVFITGWCVRDGNEERKLCSREDQAQMPKGRKMMMSIFSYCVRLHLFLYTAPHICCVLYVYEHSVMIDSQAAPIGLHRLWPLTLKSPVRFNDPVLSQPGICYRGNIAFFPPLIMQESSPSMSNSVSSQVSDLWRDVCSLISISTDVLFVSLKLVLGFLLVKYYSSYTVTSAKISHAKRLHYMINTPPKRHKLKIFWV